MLPLSTRSQLFQNFSFYFTRIDRHLYATIVAPNLQYIAHAFSKQQASQKFYLADKQRLFAPWNLGGPGLVVSDKDPVNKVFFPFWGVNATTEGVSYNGEYGVTRTKFVIVDGKVRTKTETDWYPIQGDLKSCTYTPENLSLYAGYSWDAQPVEESFKGFKFTKTLTNFNPENNVDSETFLDPFLKRSAVGREEAGHHIYNLENNRAERDIRKRVRCDAIEIHRVSIQRLELSICSIYLPGYTLEYPGNPPRIIPALKQNQKKVYGHVAISSTKVAGLVSAISTAVLPFLPPQMSLPMRIGAVVIPTVASALWAHFRGNITSHRQQQRIEAAREENDSVSETAGDKARRLTTSGKIFEDEPVAGELPSVFRLNIDQKYFLILGLTPGQQVNERIVIEAFHHRLQQIHPDRQVNKDQKTQQEFTEKTRQLIQAKEIVVKAIREKNTKYEGKRFYSTSREPLRSTWDSRAAKLIHAVLNEQNYEKALKLVHEEEIHPDSHDDGENTLLTEAALWGDLKGILFAVELGASLDTSCACPANMTALHYAAVNGDEKIVEVLIKLGANPNLNNSFGQTPLDVAILNDHQEVIELLEKYGAVRHYTVDGAKGIARRIRGVLFGYSKRTEALPSGIYEPKALPRDSE